VPLSHQESLLFEYDSHHDETIYLLQGQHDRSHHDQLIFPILSITILNDIGFFILQRICLVSI